MHTVDNDRYKLTLILLRFLFEGQSAAASKSVEDAVLLVVDNVCVARTYSRANDMHCAEQ